MYFIDGPQVIQDLFRFPSLIVVGKERPVNMQIDIVLQGFIISVKELKQSCILRGIPHRIDQGLHSFFQIFVRTPGYGP
jgi:hypothetical protein